MRTLLILAASFFALNVASAPAEMRTAVIVDPRDQPEVLSGTRKPDVQTVTTTYDADNGNIAIAIGFYEPLPVRLDEPELYPTVGIGLTRLFDRDGNKTICPYGPQSYGDVGGFISLTRLNGKLNDLGQFNLEGLDGSAPLAVYVSEDRRTINLAATHLALVGRDYRCVSIRPPYDDEVDDFWFAGYKPKPKRVKVTRRTAKKLVRSVLVDEHPSAYDYWVRCENKNRRRHAHVWRCGKAWQHSLRCANGAAYRVEFWRDDDYVDKDVYFYQRRTSPVLRVCV